MFMGAVYCRRARGSERAGPSCRGDGVVCRKILALGTIVVLWSAGVIADEHWLEMACPGIDYRDGAAQLWACFGAAGEPSRRTTRQYDPGVLLPLPRLDRSL